MAIVEVGRIGRDALLAVARRLDEAGRGIALLDGEGWGGVVLGVDPVEEQRIEVTAVALETAARMIDAGTDGASGTRALRWMGYVAYESARGAIERADWVEVDRRAAPFGAAAILRRYGAVARWSAREGLTLVEGDDAASVRRLCEELRRAGDRPAPPSIDLHLRPTDGDDDHRARVVAALDLIARGHVYVVNLARLYEGPCDAPATALLDALHRRGRARYGAAIDFGDHVVASASPERFLEVHGRRVLTSPIKGTRPRGVDAESDRAQVEALDRDPKEIAELTMVVDLERNDLGRVAETGSVRVLGAPRIETTRTVHHRVHDVAAVLRRDATLGELVRATLPSGSVTGAPKVRAMEIIATLEPTRRGLYCGAILALSDKDNLVASMAIRTVVAQGGIARYHAGGGIVADSNPDREVAETGWKARPVAHG